MNVARTHWSVDPPSPHRLTAAPELQHSNGIFDWTAAVTWWRVDLSVMMSTTSVLFLTVITEGYICTFAWSVFVCLYGINSVTEWWFVSSGFYELHKAAHLFFWFKGLFENSLTVSCTVSMDGMHFFYFYFYFLSHNQKNFMWLNLFSNPSALSYSLVLTLQLKWWLCTNPAERRK